MLFRSVSQSRYGSSKQGWFNTSLEPTDNILPILDGILQYVPAPKVEEGNLQMQVTSLDYSSFLGRIAVGKVTRGSLKESQWIGPEVVELVALLFSNKVRGDGV